MSDKDLKYLTVQGYLGLSLFDTNPRNEPDLAGNDIAGARLATTDSSGSSRNTKDEYNKKREFILNQSRKYSIRYLDLIHSYGLMHSSEDIVFFVSNI